MKKFIYFLIALIVIISVAKITSKYFLDSEIKIVRAEDEEKEDEEEDKKDEQENEYEKEKTPIPTKIPATKAPTTIMQPTKIVQPTKATQPVKKVIGDKELPFVAATKDIEIPTVTPTYTSDILKYYVVEDNNLNGIDDSWES